MQSRPGQIQNRTTVLVLLVFSLFACEGDTKKSDPVANYLLLNSDQGLIAVDPENPDEYVSVADANSVSNRTPAIAISHFQDYVDVPSNAIPYAFYAKDNHFYLLNLAKPAALRPIQVSSEAEADSVCEIERETRGESPVPKIEIRYELPGPDGECFGTDINGIDARVDNIIKYLDLGMSHLDTPRLTPKDGDSSDFPDDFANFFYGSELVFYTYDPDVSEPNNPWIVQGRLIVENSNLIWYPEAVGGISAVVLENVGQVRLSDSVLIRDRNFIAVDDRLYLFELTTGTLHGPIHTYADTGDMQNWVRRVPQTMTQTMNGSGVNQTFDHYLFDGGNLYFLKPQSQSFIPQQLNLADETYAYARIFAFSSTQFVLRDYTSDGEVFYTLPRQGGARNLFVPIGYKYYTSALRMEFQSGRINYAFYSELENKLIVVDNSGAVVLEFPNTRVLYTYIGIGTHLVTISGADTDTGRQVGLLNILSGRIDIEFGTVDGAVADYDAELYALGKSYYALSLQSGALIPDEPIYIVDREKPGVLSEIFPQVTGKSLLQSSYYQ